jgi:hypothetical protein
MPWKTRSMDAAMVPQRFAALRPGLNVVADDRMIFVNEEDEPWFAKLDRTVAFHQGDANVPSRWHGAHI